MATGLADDKVAQQYAKAVVKSKASWAGLDAQRRMEALITPANDALAALGVPKVMPLIDPLGTMAGTANRASFSRGTWTMWFNTDLLGPLADDQDFGRRANTTYHEARHAEQSFRVARRLAGEGKSADVIAKTILIPATIAAAAQAKPLSAKQKDEWSEADAWLFNMQVDADGESRADQVNAVHTKVVKTYNEVRGVYRSIQRGANGAADADPAIVAIIDEQRKKPGGAQRLDELIAHWRDQYVFARERAKQGYLLYAKMPLEQDAWATGGLIEKHLGLPPSTPEQELNNLDADERIMIPAQIAPLVHGSDREKAVVAAISTSLASSTTT